MGIGYFFMVLRTAAIGPLRRRCLATPSPDGSGGQKANSAGDYILDELNTTLQAATNRTPPFRMRNRHLYHDDGDDGPK